LSNPADFDLKERVRSAVDIVDVIGATLELQPAGRNMVARCPWHNDRRPSLTVNRQRQTWKCWPCDIGGDVFSFVMKRDGIDFPAALRMLAEQAGIPLEQYTRGKQTEPGSPEDKATLLSAMQLVADTYFQLLETPGSDDAKVARDYLHDRGIDDENRQRFQIGFAPDSWSFAVDLLKKNGFSGEVATAAGIATPRKSGSGFVDMFRGRLMFPIHDLQNRPISLGGRVIPEIAARHGENAGGKYINGRETKLFRKSHQLYGLNWARDAIRRDGEALVMEGYTDVVAARQAGVEAVVAVLGTALGTEHVKILNRFAERVVLVLDGDAAGQRRADEVLELFVQADVDLRILTLPDGSDPADYLAAHGREAFQGLVEAAPDALDHKLNRLTEGIDFTRDTHAVTSAIDTMLGVIAKGGRDGNLKTDQMMLRMARMFGIGTERLNERLKQLRARQQQRSYSQANLSRQGISTSGGADPNASLAQAADDFSSYAAPQSAAATHAPQPLTGIDRELFETLIEAPDLAALAVEAIDPDWLETNTAKMLLSVYQDLELEGRNLDVQSLLLRLENEYLKNQVVSLDDRVRDRQGKSTQTPEDRYTTVLLRYRQRESDAEKTRQIARLETAALPQEEEDALLKELFATEAARHRQSIKSD
jgi:DNA primase